ncbi:MAG: cupin domain-containing protein [Acidobacteriota bacterium]|nr:cupin domain-containing protein [Acidobacteriota bacterium]
MIAAFGFQLRSNAQTKPAPGRREKKINPLVLTPEESKAVATDSGTVRFLVNSEDTNGAFATLEVTEREYATDLHRHNFTDEAYYVLEGTLTVYVGGKIHKLGPGSYLFIPKGTPHAQGNLGKTPVKVLLTVTPGGFEGFMRDRAELIKRTPRGSPDFMKRIYEIVKKYDLERLGDSPLEK